MVRESNKDKERDINNSSSTLSLSFSHVSSFRNTLDHDSFPRFDLHCVLISSCSRSRSVLFRFLFSRLFCSFVVRTYVYNVAGELNVTRITQDRTVE